MDTVKKLFNASNLGTVVFFFLNILLMLYIFTGGFIYISAVPAIVVLYIISILVALSPLGEELLSIIAGAKEMKRIDMKIRMIPLLEIVYSKAKAKSPHMVDTIRLKIIQDPTPNAFALGRRTICVTEGLFQLSDDMILGVFAHEVGHLANRHTEIQLLIGGANLLITSFMLIIKAMAWFTAGIFGLFALRRRNDVSGCLVGIIGVITTVVIWGWTKFCMIFLVHSMRTNEYVADEYAYNIGFGYELACAIDVTNLNLPKNGLLTALYSTHPSVNDRIARLQELGVLYYRY